jgi:hypothetical protein
MVRRQPTHNPCASSRQMSTQGEGAAASVMRRPAAARRRPADLTIAELLCVLRRARLSARPDPAAESEAI